MTAGRRRVHSEDGQALIIVVLFLIVMLGFCALCLDVGHAYLAQRRLQSSVDAAALAGAQELPDVAGATTWANTYGSGGSNDPSGLDSVTMSVSTRCIASIPGCAPANAVVVKETGVVKTTFAKLLGVGSFTVHASATACSPCGEKPLDVMLVLDRTGSMCTDAAGNQDPGCTDMENARNGIKTFLSFMNPALDHVGLAVLPPATSMAKKCDPPSATSYNSLASPYVLVPLSSDYKTGTGLNDSSDLVSTIDCVKAAGSTAYANAIDAAQAEIVQDGRPGTQKVIVFLSDGAANTGPTYYPAGSPYRVTPCHQGETSATIATAAGSTVYSIGYDVGHDVCKNSNGSAESPSITALQALQGIASNSSQFYNQPNAAQLNTIFAAIANDVLHGASRLVDDNAS